MLVGKSACCLSRTWLHSLAVCGLGHCGVTSRSQLSVKVKVRCEGEELDSIQE
jgi:hypothetical protein